MDFRLDQYVSAEYKCVFATLLKPVLAVDEIAGMWPPVLKAETPPEGGAIPVGVGTRGSRPASQHLISSPPLATCVTLASHASMTSPVSWG